MEIFVKKIFILKKMEKLLFLIKIIYLEVRPLIKEFMKILALHVLLQNNENE